MESPFTEKAIPMVSVNESTGKYVLTNQAINFLRAIQGPIAVVSVAGLYRTGKSYLLNRVLLNRSNGFGVGPTVNPCTKGLWCWGTPIKGTSSDGEQVNIIVIDTEGIGALDEDTTHDTKIFTLAILASSCFIYNSVGSIDENAIQNLSLVVNLTKHIQLKASGQDEDGEDPDQISIYFPSFYWVVRDFSLQLQDPQGNPISSKQYLEKALAPQNGFSDDIEEKNRIRRLLTAFFKDRDCYTMIRPLVDEQKLQNLDKMDYDELRPEFVHQAMSFRKRILSSVKVKSLQNQKLNGDLYCSMVSAYVNAINEGAVPNIENAWNYMCQQQCRKSLDDCYELFIKEMKEGFRDFPKPEEEFNKCVNQAEEKALEAFREKALGDRAVLVLKELKNRIKTQIAEVREQNAKQSNQQIRNYILKQVTPIKKKLTSQQYRTYQQFEKELLIMEERLMKDGPKLHNYKLIYMEAMRKLSAQGAQFLFKNFTKVQEKDKEMFKLREKELQAQLDTVTQEKDNIRKDYMEATTSSDQRISDLSYKLETMTAQLNMTSKAKEEEERKMEREFTAKYHELESNRKLMEAKIRELMDKMQENKKAYNIEKKQWQKQMAVLDLKTKQQTLQIQELTKKEKAESANWNLEKNNMASQVREITQRNQREKEELKFRLKEFEDKNNQLQEELNSMKEELDSKTEKLEKKDKKLKEEVTNKNRQIERIKKEFEMEKKQLRDQFEVMKQNTNRDSTLIEEKLKEAQKNLKELNDRFKKEKHSLESEKELVEQRYELLQTEYDTLKKNNANLKEQYEVTIVSLEQTFIQRNEETFTSKITDIKSQHEVEINTIRGDFQNEKKRLVFELNNLIKKNEQSEALCQGLKLESSKKTIELQNIIEQLNDEIKHLKNSQKTLEGERITEFQDKESRYKAMIRELENEIEDIKDKAHNQKMEQLRQSEESISQIKNGYEMEKENLERRLRSQKDKYENRINDLTAEHERKLEEQTEPLLNDIQELRQNLFNSEEMMRNQLTRMQHETDIAMKRAESLEKANNELKDLHERKEKEFNTKYETFYSQSKIEKEKLENKIQGLINQSNKKDKDLMSTIHSRDQLASTLDKKENKIKELQAEMLAQKEALTEQIDKLQVKLTIIEKDHHDKMTNYERENALLKQKDEFNLNKIAELEKMLQSTNQIYEEKMNRFKEEKEKEVKQTFQKLQAEKNQFEKKYKDYKFNAKDIEAGLRKTINDLLKEKQLMEVKVMNQEEKYRELEEKKTTDIASLQNELAKIKEAYNLIKGSYDSDCNNYRAQIDKLESQLNDMVLKFEKEKSLSEQKIAFLTNSKEENKKDYEDRIRKLQAQLSQMQNLRNNEKSTYDNYSRQIIVNTETKYNERITVLNEEILRKTSEYEAVIKEKDHLIKELRQKYETEKLHRETMISKMEKRLNEVSENQRRLREEIDRLKADRDKKETEYLRKERQDKDNYKNKISTLESKMKDLEQEKMRTYFEFEKDKSKWNLQRENMSEMLVNMQDINKKLEKDKDKYKIEVEKLKAERRNTKTHSYIGNLKTTYEPTKQIVVEENNKQNNFNQQ